MFWEPHEYQKEAVKFLVEKGSAALWLDPGLGKTAVVLSAFRTLKLKGLAKKMLVIAPLRPVHGVWPLEAKKWEQFADYSVGVLHGGTKAKVLKQNHDIYVINFEGLGWLSSQLNGKDWPFQILTVDEISYMKNTQTQRFKTIKPLLDKFDRRWGLTGSPAPNSLLDIFGPQLILDQGATFGPYISRFRTEYFFPSGYGGYEWKLQSDGEARIHEALAGKVLRMAALDHLDLPELTYNDIMVDLPPKARKLYDAFENDLTVELNSGNVTAVNAAVAVMKGQQIANGGSYLDDDGSGNARISTHLHDAKTEAVEELVEELSGQPCIIGYHFAHDLERLRQVFPSAPIIGSGVVGAKLDKIIADWNAGEIPVLLAHPMSAGHGLNLQGSGHAVIWYSLTWSLEIYEQFIRRLWRQGQKNHIVVHHIMAKDTVDEAIMMAIRRKDKTQQTLLTAVRDYINRDTINHVDH
jgi:SNF2 family DNA or RNA helicase